MQDKLFLILGVLLMCYASYQYGRNSRLKLDQLRMDVANNLLKIYGYALKAVYPTCNQEQQETINRAIEAGNKAYRTLKEVEGANSFAD